MAKVYRCMQCGNVIPMGHADCPLCGCATSEQAFRPRYPWLMDSGLFKSIIGPYLRGSLTTIFIYLMFAAIPTLVFAKAWIPLVVLSQPDAILTYAVVSPGLAIALRNFRVGPVGSVVTGFVLFFAVFAYHPMQNVGFWLDDPGHGALQHFIQSIFGAFLAWILYWEREVMDWYCSK